MSDTPQEKVAEALIRQLLRRGILDREDIAAMTEGEDDPQTARDIAACLLETEAPTQAEFEADHRRRQFRVIPRDGGNDPD